jgi:hypothetical protein
MVTEDNIGRPSSTAALGWLFLLPHVLLAAGKGLAPGALAWLIVRVARVQRRVSIPVSLVIVIPPALIAAIVGAKGGAKRIEDAEQTNRPRVISSAGGLQKVKGEPSTCAVRLDAVKVCEARSSEPRAPAPLLSLGATITCNGGNIVLESAARRSSTDLNAYDYVREVLAVPLEGMKPNAGVALLVRLRATGGRSVLLVYDSSLRVLHQELLERAGMNDALWTCSDSSGARGELVVRTARDAHYRFELPP